MEFEYYTNNVITRKSTAEWFFGKKLVKATADQLVKLNAKDGRKELKVWQDGTGYLTVKIF